MGEEYAEVVIGNKLIKEEKNRNELRPIIRVATHKDKLHNDEK